MQRPFAFRIFPHRKCAGLVSLWVFCTFSGSEIAQMAVFYGRYSSFSDILVHFQDDKISLNVQSCEKLLHLSIFRRESPVQDTASHGTGRHPMAPDAKRFHAVPNNRTDSRSSMLHPTAPPPTFGPQTARKPARLSSRTGFFFYMMEPDTARRKRLGRTTQPDRRPAPNKSGPALEADRRPRRE